MHLIIDIRSESPGDPIIIRYAKNWVDLWISRHPTDIVSYIHYITQDCPANSWSIIVSPKKWHWSAKKLTVPNSNEAFRCVNFSSYEPYDPSVYTLSHMWDHTDILYPRYEQSIIDHWIGSILKKRNRKNEVIVVPSLGIGQEAVEIYHLKEENIEIIPYISLPQDIWDSHILAQLSIVWSYWLYDGTYGSESGIVNLLKWYRDYRALGGDHMLLLLGKQSRTETQDIAMQIQALGLTGSVRIMGLLDPMSTESLYRYASGWIYIGAYYSGGPRIELARAYQIPLLLSNIESLSEYHSGALTIHPSHLAPLGQMLLDLEWIEQTEYHKIPNSTIMTAYERIIAQKR